MNRDKFISYLETPGELGETSLEEIRGVLNEYPYFQTAHMLVVKALSNLQDVRFSNQLKFSAAHIGDRHTLFNLVNEPGVTVSTLAGHSGTAGQLEKEKIPVRPGTSKKTEPEQGSGEPFITGEKGSRISKPEVPSGDPEEGVVQERAAVKTPESLADKVMRDLEEIKKSRAANAASDADGTGGEQVKAGQSQSADKEEGKYPAGGPDEKTVSTGESIQDVLIIDEKADIEESPGIQTLTPVKNRKEEEEPEPAGKVDPDLLELEKPATSSGRDNKTESPDGEDKAVKPEKKNTISAGDLNSESHSFAEWLDLFQYEPSVLPEENREQLSEQQKISDTGTGDDKPGSDKNEKTDLIDRFLKEKPRIEPRSPLDDGTSPADMSEKSTRESDEFFTETLAQIYIQQKHYKKAIYAYEKLCLKYPEKYSYFADRIDEIKRMVNQ